MTLRLLHRVGDRKHGSNFNSPEEIMACNDPLSFDGIYESVWDYRKLLKGKDITLFVMGNYVGKGNAFDKGQPYSLFLDWDHIIELAEYLNAKIGWHTRSHRALNCLPEEEILKEITPPFKMDYIAYPGGHVTPKVIELCKQVGYKDGYCAGHRGDGTEFQRKRPYLNW